LKYWERLGYKLAGDEDGRTPLDLARKYNRLNVVDFLENTSRSIVRAPIILVMLAVQTMETPLGLAMREFPPRNTGVQIHGLLGDPDSARDIRLSM